MALIRRWYKERKVEDRERKVEDMDMEELDKEYDRHEDLVSESGKSSYERLSLSPEEFQNSFSPFSSERETPSPPPDKLWVQDSPPDIESSSTRTDRGREEERPTGGQTEERPPTGAQTEERPEEADQGREEDHPTGGQTEEGQRRLSRGEAEAREEGIDIFISYYQIIHMDNNELKEELKRLMSERGMTQDQYHKCLELRKKGKNKAAAQASRAKKDKELAFLETCVQLRKKEYPKKLEALKKLRSEKLEWERYLEELSALVCISQNKNPIIWRVVLDKNSDNIEFVLRDRHPTCL